MILTHIILGSLIRGIDLAGMILLVGGSVFRTLVVSPSSGRNSLLERCLPLLLLGIGLADLVMRSQMISGRPLVEVWPFVPTVLIKSHFGKVWMARTFLLCFLGLTSMINIPKREGLSLTASGLLLLTASLSGHAADSGDLSLAVLADWLHFLAVSAWAGGLFFLAAVMRQWILSLKTDPTTPNFVGSVKRFSTLAGVCVALILATGSYQIWHRVGSLAALLQTQYGKTLIVKLILVLPLLGLGALNRYRILPELSQHTVARSAALAGRALRRLLNIVGLEIGLGLTILACVALLIQLPPARGQWATLFQASSHPMSHLRQGEMPPLKLQPAEGASVEIFSPRPGEVYKSDEVPIRYKFVKGRKGAHLHAYVDGELMGMFSHPEKGTLTGIKPGRHVLELRVVAEDHQTELDATDRVDFVVQ